MNTSNKTLLQGHLIYTPIEWYEASKQGQTSLKSSWIHSFQTLQNSWQIYKFESLEALIDKENEEPPYHYDIINRQSKQRSLMLSRKRSVVDYFLHRFTTERGMPSLENVYIDVNGLVKSLYEKPTEYVVVYLHARTSGMNPYLRSISLYGADLTKASLFRENVENLKSHTCGLKSIKSDDQSLEVLRLSNEGHVSFYYAGEGDLLAAELALHFVSQGGYLLEPRGLGPRVRSVDENNPREEKPT